MNRNLTISGTLLVLGILLIIWTAALTSGPPPMPMAPAPVGLSGRSLLVATNPVVVVPKTNASLIWVEKRTVQHSTNLTGPWTDMIVMVTNTVYVPTALPQEYFRVYCGEISSDLVVDFQQIKWQTNLYTIIQ